MATATTAHTEVPGAPKVTFPPLQTENFPSQLLWLTICFVALYLIAAKLALPRVGSIIQARRDHISGDLAQAAKLKERSDSALAAYELALADARNRAQAEANAARERLNAESEKARRALEAKLNAKLAEAERSIVATRNAAMANVHGIAAEAAAAIVQRLTGTAPTAAAAEAAVTGALKR